MSNQADSLELRSSICVVCETKEEVRQLARRGVLAVATRTLFQSPLAECALLPETTRIVFGYDNNQHAKRATSQHARILQARFKNVYVIDWPESVQSLKSWFENGGTIEGLAKFVRPIE